MGFDVGTEKIAESTEEQKEKVKNNLKSSYIQTIISSNQNCCFLPSSNFLYLKLSYVSKNHCRQEIKSLCGISS